jgi:hypothetical protein
MLKAGVHATGPVHAITLLLQITLLKATPGGEVPLHPLGGEVFNKYRGGAVPRFN